MVEGESDSDLPARETADVVLLGAGSAGLVLAEVLVRTQAGRTSRWQARYVAGRDGRHLISPSAAQGANLAVLEAEVLAEALIADLQHQDAAPLANYSAPCLARIWRAREFSRWMIRLLHGAPGPDARAAFADALRRARSESVRTGRAHQDWFAENYVGV